MKQLLKRFPGAYFTCLFLVGLLLVLCMGCPVGMVLLAAIERYSLLFWATAALVPAIPALAWAARK